MNTCTVAALDAITAFAVPNPNCPSQSQSVFSGLVALAGHPAEHYPFERTAEAYSRMLSGKAEFRVVLTM